jgi:hypothetical protein
MPWLLRSSPRKNDMAGKRQHYIPQFLLKGFASRCQGKEAFVWVHKKEGAVFEANVRNIALEKYFYGSATDNSLDVEITSLESDFAKVLNHTRSVSHGSNISGTGIEEFVTNMSVRHKYLRFGMIDSFSWLLEEMESFYSVPSNGEVFTRNYLKKNPQVLQQALDDALLRLPYSSGQKAMLRRQILAMPTADLINLAGAFFQDALADFKLDVFPQIRANMSDVIKGSHIKALARSLVSTPRLSALKELRWSVHDIGEPLILGDVCVLFDVEGYDSWLPLSGAADRVKNV